MNYKIGNSSAADGHLGRCTLLESSIAHSFHCTVQVFAINRLPIRSLVWVNRLSLNLKLINKRFCSFLINRSFTCEFNKFENWNASRNVNARLCQHLWIKMKVIEFEPKSNVAKWWHVNNDVSDLEQKHWWMQGYINLLLFIIKIELRFVLILSFLVIAGGGNTRNADAIYTLSEWKLMMQSLCRELPCI